MAEPAQSAASYGRISQAFMLEAENPPSLERVVLKAVETLPACAAASISLAAKGGRFTTPAASHPLAEACDHLQYDLGEGPCIFAVFGEGAVYIADTRRDDRFAAWGPRAAQRGVLSVLSAPMFGNKGRNAALNFYSRQVDGYSDDEIDLGLVFTALAALALHTSQLVSGLSTALGSRHLIGIAQGILMVRYHISQDRAFQVLKRYSNDTHIAVRELARQVVEVGRLPNGGPHPEQVPPAEPV